jgi:hypothetical protein
MSICHVLLSRLLRRKKSTIALWKTCNNEMQ